MGLVIHDRERKVQPILPIYKVSYRNRKPYASLAQGIEHRSSTSRVLVRVQEEAKHANSIVDTDIGIGIKIDMWL